MRAGWRWKARGEVSGSDTRQRSAQSIHLPKRSVDTQDVREFGQVDLRIPPRIGDLRHKHDVGERDAVSDAEVSTSRQHLLQNLEATDDPVRIPDSDRAIIGAELRTQTRERRCVVQRMNIRNNLVLQITNVSAEKGITRQQRRLWSRLVEIFNHGH